MYSKTVTSGCFILVQEELMKGNKMQLKYKVSTVN